MMTSHVRQSGSSGRRSSRSTARTPCRPCPVSLQPAPFSCSSTPVWPLPSWGSTRCFLSRRPRTSRRTRDRPLWGCSFLTSLQGSSCQRAPSRCTLTTNSSSQSFRPTPFPA